MSTCRNFFYGRVSSDSQSLNRQLDALKNFIETNPDISVDERDIFLDKKSGKNFNRTEYLTLKRILRPNDLLIITSLDRFSRNYRNVVDEWRELTEEKKINILVLDMPLLDTRQNKDLLGGFISNLVLQILSYVSEQERLSIISRQKMGIESAKRRNVQFGAPKIKIDFDSYEFKQLYKAWKADKIKTKHFMNKLELKPNTFYRRIHEFELLNNKNKE